ncbi:hypothetical protein ASD76_09380 [Altererythrobacter sp. Root672]|nr:hypothetical protein ASD76_09380 [Altererythrobacter sp. Root672]
MAINMGPYLAVDKFEVTVDPDKIISPMQRDIPIGAFCLIGGRPMLAVAENHATSFVALDGEIEGIPPFDRLVAFASWRICVVDGDERYVVHEADLAAA